MQLKSQVTKKLKNRFLVFVFSSLKKKKKKFSKVDDGKDSRHRNPVVLYLWCPHSDVSPSALRSSQSDIHIT